MLRVLDYAFSPSGGCVAGRCFQSEDSFFVSVGEEELRFGDYTFVGRSRYYAGGRGTIRFFIAEK